MKLEIGATYTSGSLLHQRKLVAFNGDEVVYQVISSHCSHVIGAERSCFWPEFEKWAKRRAELKQVA